MLTSGQFDVWLDRLAIPQDGRALIRQIRQSDPHRRVAGRASNVSGRYPSRKMGFTVQFESHLVELAFIYEFEHDPDVLEYYDQPCSLGLTYAGSNGRAVSARHTPDFFVLRTHAAGWEECKDSNDLPRLAAKTPNRYKVEQDGTWRCPPGEVAARSFNLYYRIRSSAEIDWSLQRNLRYLSDFRRTLPSASVPMSDRQRSILEAVRMQPGVRLRDLLAPSADDNAELFAMIADELIYVNLRAAAIAEPERVRVFLDEHIASAVHDLEVPQLARPTATTLTIRSGQPVKWDGQPWRIVNVGDTAVSLINDQHELTDLPRTSFDRLASAGVIVDIENGSSRAGREKLASANDDDLKVANSRLTVVLAHINRATMPETATVSARTVRKWTARYKAAQQQTGSGYVGLLPNTMDKGNRCPKLPADSIRLMNDCIDGQYLTLAQKLGLPLGRF